MQKPKTFKTVSYIFLIFVSADKFVNILSFKINHFSNVGFVRFEDFRSKKYFKCSY